MLARILSWRILAASVRISSARSRSFLILASAFSRVGTLMCAAPNDVDSRYLGAVSLTKIYRARFAPDSGHCSALQRIDSQAHEPTLRNDKTCPCSCVRFTLATETK